MREEILDRNVARRWIGFVERAARNLQNTHSCEFRRPPYDRVIEPKLAFFHQHEGDRGRDRLGHRTNAKQRVPLHGQIAPQVAPPRSGPMGNRSVSPNQRNRPRELSPCDRLLDRGRDPFQNARRERSFAAHRSGQSVSLSIPGAERLATASRRV